MRYLIHSRPRIAILARHVVTASVLGFLHGCGGDGASTAETSRAEISTASAEVTSGAVALAQDGTVRAGLDDAVTSYDRIATPAGGSSPLSAPDIAAAQAAFDKVGDDLSKL